MNIKPEWLTPKEAELCILKILKVQPPETAQEIIRKINELLHEEEK